MAQGIPGKVLAIQDDELRTGRVAFGDEEQEVSLALLEDAKIGDYVLVQAGSAVQTVSEKQAQEIFNLLKEMGPEEDTRA
jgi:hydrogenase expression/formation protein HypC